MPVFNPTSPPPTSGLWESRGTKLNMCPVLYRSSELSELAEIQQLISIGLFRPWKDLVWLLSVVLHQGLMMRPIWLGMWALPLLALGHMYIFSGMPERHCCLLLKGLPRSPNVMFPSPVHSVTHSPLIAVVGVLMERMARMWSQLLGGFVRGDKGISGHVNNVEDGYKRNSSELGAATKYHGCWAESHSFCSGKSPQSLTQNWTSSWPDCNVIICTCNFAVQLC